MRRTTSNIFILLLLIGWIIPVAYFGFTNGAPPWLPAFLIQRTNVSRLFYREQSGFWIYELSYRRENCINFEPFCEQDYFRMYPFGYRTRFQRFMSSSNPEVREAISLWIKNKLDADNGENPVREIRITRFAYLAKAEGKPTGHYRQPQSADLTKAVIHPIANFEY